MQYDIISLSKRPELFEAAADWFSAKWSVPKQAYLDSMAESRTSKTGVPEWYVMMDRGAIIAGLGVIANDFHKRPDLTPNLCALFVEEPCRKRGLAKHLLNHACDELAAHGIETAYLITDHTDFYERCGWDFYTMVEEDDGGRARMYRRSTAEPQAERKPAPKICYRPAAPSDAAKLLEYLKTIGGETDNLTFGPEGLPYTEEQEAAILKSFVGSPHSRLFLALDGERIVGNAFVGGNGRPRFRHRAELAISVLREYWGKGIGSGLMAQMIDFARETGAELLSLEVRADNERAKALYRRFGFERYGTFPKFFKIGGQYYDADCMTLDLSTVSE